MKGKLVSHTVRNMLIAAALFVFGLVLITSYLHGQSSQLERGNDFIRVLVAQKDIPAGTSAAAIESGGYVESTKVLRRDAAPHAIHDITDVKKLALSQNVYAGEQLSAYKFETQSALNPADQQKGTQRIIAVHVKPSGTAAQLIKPGDHVDIAVSYEQNQVTNTTIVARDVTVLQTPDSLASQGGASPTDTKEPLKANDDPTLWVLQASDATMQSILWGQAAANDDGLQFLLRGSTSATNTKLPTIATVDAN